MSYFFHAFLFSDEPPSATAARQYLLDGALFDERPEISIQLSSADMFEEMILNYDPARRPIILRRLSGEDAQTNREEAIEAAATADRKDIADAIRVARLVLEWQVERSELNDDAWFALHLWQAWILGPSKGWLYTLDDGIFDFELQRQCFRK